MSISAAAELRRRAEVPLETQAPETGLSRKESETQRLHHELQVHQVELETQNAELRHSRNEVEKTLEKYFDLKQSEQSLRVSEELFRILSDNSPVGIALHDRELRHLYVNPTITRITGLPLETFLGKTVWEVGMPSEAASQLDSLLRTVLDTGEINNGELVFPASGGPHYFTWRSVPIPAADGSVKAVLAIASDITERKRAEDSLRMANDELETRVRERTEELAASVEILREEILERLQAVESLRAKEQMFTQQNRLAGMGEMINSIAHQWRQPLNVLGLMVQQMQICFDMGKLSKEFVDTNVSKSMGLINHMSQTINDFMNFFKQDKEKVEFAVHEVVARTVSLIEDNFKSQQVRIDLKTDANPVIIGFPNEYCQVLLNILTNARDALLERRPDDATITVIINNQQGKSVVTISDNAGGIAADALGKIFDPYFTTKGPDMGTGVGLFMSKTIIEKNMNGKLTARNSVKGAEFRIEV